MTKKSLSDNKLTTSRSACFHIAVWAEKHFDNIWPNWKDGMNNALKDDILDIGKCNETLISSILLKTYFC